MGRFEDIVEEYVVHSQAFVIKNEKVIHEFFSRYYCNNDDKFFEDNLRFTKAELNEKGLEQLVKEKKHLPVAEFYCGIAGKIKEEILSETQGRNSVINAFFSVIFGFRIDIERNELEHEYEANQDLSDDKLVEYLLKLRGPFAARAFTACRAPYLNSFDVKVIEYTLVMALLSAITTYYLKNYCDKESEIQKKGKEEQEDEEEHFLDEPNWKPDPSSESGPTIDSTEI